MTIASWNRIAFGAVAALAMLEIAWEMRLAPLRPGGSWLVLKAVPLVVLLPPLLRGRTKAKQWAVLLVPFYAAEGIVRALSERGQYRVMAAIATLVAAIAFLTLLASFRAERKARNSSRQAETLKIES